MSHRISLSTCWICLLALVAAAGGLTCDPPTDPSGDLLPGGAPSNGEFILYSHPDDPRILGGLSDDGEGLTVYADKDGDGLPTNLTALRYQTPDQLDTDEATWVFFDETGQLRKMLGVDGSTIEFDWKSATRVVVSGVSGDGSTQVNTTVDLSNPSPGKPKVPATGPDVPSRIGVPMRIEMRRGPVFDGDATRRAAGSTGAKGSAAAASNNTVIVFVERCNQPLDGAEVFVTFGSPFDAAVPSFLANPTGTSGEYKARLPVSEPIIDIAESEICQAIAENLGHGCTFLKVPGAEVQLCLELGAAVAAGTLDPPAGGGVTLLCEVGFQGLSAYCATLGASAGPGAPSLADAICQRIKQNEASGLVPGNRAEIQAFARLPGVPQGTSQAVDVPATGPFPELSIDLGGDIEVLDRFSTAPTDPEPGESYIATARLSCVAADSVIRLTISGTDGFSNSTELTVPGGNPNPVIDLHVPGASAETVDTLTVEIVGGLLKREIFVVF